MTKNMQTKGQTSMVLLVVVIIIFMALGVFLISMIIKSDTSDYENLYTHNLLISVLRKDTGYDPPCETVSSVLSCFHRQIQCSDKHNIKLSCAEVADLVVPQTIEDGIKPNYDYFLRIQPENYGVAGGPSLTYGNPDVENRVPRFVANEKVLQYDFDLRIELIISNR